jgi:putative FmdB family regulatory protein
MPTYSYACTQCKHTFEVRHGVSDPAPDGCPVCVSVNLRKLIVAPAGIVFRGSGFYSTDR